MVTSGEEPAHQQRSVPRPRRCDEVASADGRVATGGYLISLTPKDGPCCAVGALKGLAEEWLISR